ncbi:MAG: 3-oxoacyl-[acyl-carrier-protein] reductase [Oligoflexia bacterium]|nr:3-oxoacyl-[acyl-carrier-protein] reductase [Oligoflexia bacterium]
MDLGIRGKNVLVTGGARGIGSNIAMSLASEGANIVVTDINEEAAVKTLDAISGLGVKAYFYSMNVADSNSVTDCVKKIQNDLGIVEILVNNAGITRDTLLIRMKEEDWDLVLNVNLKGAFNCTKAIAPIMMKNRWGRIINISSVVGVMGNKGQANYSASKAGMIGFTKSCAHEFAARNITVNAIAPGFIVSEMTNVLSGEVQNDFMSRIPLGRFGSIDEVASLVAFLASEKAAYITGQVIGINGGMLM